MAVGLSESLERLLYAIERSDKPAGDTIAKMKITSVIDIDTVADFFATESIVIKKPKYWSAEVFEMLDKMVSKSEEDEARTRAEALAREVAAPVELAVEEKPRAVQEAEISRRIEEKAVRKIAKAERRAARKEAKEAAEADEMKRVHEERKEREEKKAAKAERNAAKVAAKADEQESRAEEKSQVKELVSSSRSFSPQTPSPERQVQVVIPPWPKEKLQGFKGIPESKAPASKDDILPTIETSPVVAFKGKYDLRPRDTSNPKSYDEYIPVFRGDYFEDYSPTPSPTPSFKKRPRNAARDLPPRNRPGRVIRNCTIPIQHSVPQPTFAPFRRLQFLLPYTPSPSSQKVSKLPNTLAAEEDLPVNDSDDIELPDSLPLDLSEDSQLHGSSQEGRQLLVEEQGSHRERTPSRVGDDMAPALKRLHMAVLNIHNASTLLDLEATRIAKSNKISRSAPNCISTPSTPIPSSRSPSFISDIVPPCLTPVASLQNSSRPPCASPSTPQSSTPSTPRLASIHALRSPFASSVALSDHDSRDGYSSESDSSSDEDTPSSVATPSLQRRRTWIRRRAKMPIYRGGKALRFDAPNTV